jgi:hypothetical protein
MTNFILRVLVAVTALIIGISSVWGFGKLAAFGSRKAHFVRALLSSEHRFTPLARWSHGGYLQDYRTDDGQHINEGMRSFQTPDEAIAEFHRTFVAGSSEILERIPKFRNSHGELGERMVVRTLGREKVEWVAITWYDGGDSFTFVQAPTLELALEFEEFLNGKDNN